MSAQSTGRSSLPDTPHVGVHDEFSIERALESPNYVDNGIRGTCSEVDDLYLTEGPVVIEGNLLEGTRDILDVNVVALGMRRCPVGERRHRFGAARQLPV